jgi:hypothetical protein
MTRASEDHDDGDASGRFPGDREPLVTGVGGDRRAAAASDSTILGRETWP